MLVFLVLEKLRKLLLICSLASSHWKAQKIKMLTLTNNQVTHNKNELQCYIPFRICNILKVLSVTLWNTTCFLQTRSQTLPQMQLYTIYKTKASQK
jgi:hypothetical protein